MDCSICFDAINASTGSTTTSCGHTFHFRCLANWSIQKIQAASHQNCPLCRHEMVEAERLRDFIGENSGVRYTPEAGFFLLDSGVWIQDTLDRVRTFAQQSAQSRVRLAKSLSVMHLA
jgi:hypothetical protein